MRFIATGDLQIGMERRWLGSSQAAFDQARIEVIQTIARIATETGAGAVVVAGDLFDRDPVDKNDLARTLDALRAVDVPILLLPGNHDSYHPESVYRSASFLEFLEAAPQQVRILLEDPIEIDDCVFVGAPLLTRHPDHPAVHRVLEGLTPESQARVVVVGHGQMAEVVGDHSRSDESSAMLHLPVIEKALHDGRASFVVLGDRHSTLAVGGTGRVWYPGAPEPTDFGDDQGHVLVVDLGGEEPSVEIRRTGTWTFARLDPEIANDDAVDALLSELDALPTKIRTVVKVKPHGVVSLDALERLGAGLETARPRFAALEQDLDRLAVLPGADELGSLGLPPYALTVLHALMEAVNDEPEDVSLRDELHLLLRFARAAKAHQ